MPAKRLASSVRPEVLEGAVLQYAPENELGVVFLFSQIAKELRLRVEKIQSRFPDCIAYQKVRGKEKRIRIEFEFHSSSFAAHGHRADHCDWIVCWEHDWHNAPKHLHVEELRAHFGLGFNVWVQSVGPRYKKLISNISYQNYHWSVARNAHKGDLILFYHNLPEKCIKDVFVLTGPVKHERKANWKPSEDYEVPIARVCQLRAPIFLDDLRLHPILKTAGFVRGDMRGRPSVTEYWPYLYEKIVRRNPAARKELTKYAPEELP